MAKMLILEASGANFRLPTETDLDRLRADISMAFDEGEAISIEIEMNDDPTNNGTLILNGKAAPFVALAEVQADPRPRPVLDLAG